MDLSKLKLTELKKICKEQNLPAYGTKGELLSRISENQDNKFTVLQPGDEAELLGDDDSTSPNVSDTAILESMAKDANLAYPAPNKSTNETVNKVAAKRSSDNIPSSEQEPKLVKISFDVIEPSSNVPDVESDVLSDAQRLTRRVERFACSNASNVSDGQVNKLALRAQRFGLSLDKMNPTSTDGGGNGTADLDKLKMRAERFGETTSKILEDVKELERKEKRMMKFSPDTSLPSQSNSCSLANSNLSDTDKLAKRRARFGII